MPQACSLRLLPAGTDLSSPMEVSFLGQCALGKEHPQITQGLLTESVADPEILTDLFLIQKQTEYLAFHPVGEWGPQGWRNPQPARPFTTSGVSVMTAWGEALDGGEVSARRFRPGQHEDEDGWPGVPEIFTALETG